MRRLRGPRRATPGRAGSGARRFEAASPRRVATGGYRQASRRAPTRRGRARWTGDRAAGPSEAPSRPPRPSARRTPAPRSGTESHGGEKATSATRTATTPAGIAMRPDKVVVRSSDIPMPAITNTGSPTAGIVQTQSPPVCTAKYAAVPSAPVAASDVRARRPSTSSTSAPDPTTRRKPRIRFPRARRARSSAREGAPRGSPRERGTRSPQPYAPMPASGWRSNSSQATSQKS